MEVKKGYVTKYYLPVGHGSDIRCSKCQVIILTLTLTLTLTPTLTLLGAASTVASRWVTVLTYVHTTRFDTLEQRLSAITQPSEKRHRA